MTKIWIGVFWGQPNTPAQAGAPGHRNTMVAATGLAVAGTLAISIFAGAIFDLSQRAAEDLRDPAAYISVVTS